MRTKLYALVIACAASTAAYAQSSCATLKGFTLPTQSWWVPQCQSGQVLTNTKSGLQCVNGGGGGGGGSGGGLPADPVACPYGQFVNDQDQNGNLVCAQVQWSQLAGSQPTVANATHAGLADVATNCSNATTAGTAVSVPWNGITGKPSTFPAQTPVASAAQLAVAPLRCPSGQAPTGVDVFGNAAGCFSPTVGSVAWSAITGKPATFPATAPVASASALASTPALCSAGQASRGVDVNGNAQGCFTPSSGGTYSLPAAGASSLGGVKGSGGATTCAGGYVLTGFNADGSINCTAVSQVLSYIVGTGPSGDPNQTLWIDSSAVGGSGDSTPPTVTAFAMPPTATSLTVPVSNFTATDNTAVAGYMITTSAAPPSSGAAGWTSSAPSTATASGQGSTAWYAWAKDGAGNVSSSLTASTTITFPSAGTPSFTPGAGAVASGTIVTPSSTTSGATIRCTHDGSTPTGASAITSTFTVSVAETAKCIAQAAGYNDSAVGSAAYTVTSSTAAMPTFTPNGGTITGPTSVSLACASPSPTIRYTTDGSTPTGSSTVYASAITVSATSTVKAICQSSGLSDSSVASASFTLASAAATPTFSPPAGGVAAGTTITLSSLASGCSSYIYWNTTGSPTTSDTHGTTATIASSQTLYAKVIGCPGYLDSAVGSAAYTVLPQASTPTFSPTGGSYGSAQTVTISSLTAGATICYTTNGTIPQEYAGSPGSCGVGTALTNGGTVAISSTTLLYAIATKAGYAQSAAASANYTIAGGADITSVGAGTVVSATSSALSVPLPSGIQAGDLLVIVSSSGVHEPPAAPSGWTRKTTGLMALYYARATGSDTAPTLASNGGQTAVMAAFRNAVASGDPFEVVSPATSVVARTTSPASVTTATDKDMVLLAAAFDESDSYGETTPTVSWNTPTGPAATGIVTGTRGVSTSDKQGVGLWYGVKTPAGATGGATITYSGDTDTPTMAAQILALKHQ